MSFARVIAAGIVVAAFGASAIRGSEGSGVADRLLVAPNSTPSLVRGLGGARIGERSLISVAANPGTRRATFYIDDPQTSGSGVVRTRMPFALGRGSKAGDAALSPGHHLLVATVEMMDGRSKTIRASYTVVRLYLAPSGANSNPCTQTAPCKSLQRGYLVAPPGGIVETAAGVYGCEPIVGNRTAAVAIRGADGALPRVDCDLDVHASWLKLERLNIAGTVSFLAGADNSSFSSGTANGFNIFGADDVTFNANVFDGQGQVSNNKIWDDPAGSTPDRFRILNNTIRNFYGPKESDHSEGIFVGYSTDGLIVGNTFEKNGNTGHVFFTWFGKQADPFTSSPRNICVRGNKFGVTQGANYAVNFRPEIPPTAGIRIAPRPTNTLVAGLLLSNSPRMVRAC
jgi:hypothetical protein